MRIAAFLVVASLVVACAISPTGRRQLMLVPDAQIDALGQEAFQQIQQQEPVERDPAINAYVDCVADALIEQVEPNDTDWQVVVLAGDDMVNAFALPGGRIGVYTGMLRVADSQDELAAVMGHEIGHVLARHGSERVSQQMALGVGMEAVQAAMGDAQTRGLVLGALGVGAQLGVLLPYSRRHESEADVLGQQLMAQAGFDPRASVSLWESMAEVAQNGPPEFLSTHPSHGRRIEQLQAQMDDALADYRQARVAGRRPECGARLQSQR